MVATGTNTAYGWLALWDTAGVANGSYTIRARAIDAAANQGFSTPITVKVDNTAPTTTMLIPSNNASVKGNAVLLDAGASDNNTVTKVEFRNALNNTCWGPGTLTIYGWLYQWNSNNVAEGTYTIRSVAFDAAGNTGTSAPITVRVDRTAPTTAVIVPSANNTTVSGNAVLDASATDNVAVTNVQFRATGPGLDNALLGTATLTYYGWIYIWDTTTRANGTYTIRSTATDAANNTTTSANRTININN